MHTTLPSEMCIRDRFGTGGAGVAHHVHADIALGGASGDFRQPQGVRHRAGAWLRPHRGGTGLEQELHAHALRTEALVDDAAESLGRGRPLAQAQIGQVQAGVHAQLIAARTFQCGFVELERVGVALGVVGIDGLGDGGGGNDCLLYTSRCV